MNDPAPSLRPHYRAIAATTSRSAGAAPSSALRAPPASHQQPTGEHRAFSRSARERQAGLTSPPCRTPPGQSAHIRQVYPGTRDIAPVSMPAVFVTTRQQRFACARLPDPHLTPLTAPFPRSLTTTVFSQRSTRRFEASSRKATSKGLPSSPEQHHFRQLLLHAKLLPCS